MWKGTIWVRRYIWAWLQLAGLFPRSMACWDMVVAAPVELDVWVRPISWAVTGDAGKVIWSTMKNDKRKVHFVLRAGQINSNAGTYWVLGNTGGLMNQTAAGWGRRLPLTDWSLKTSAETSHTRLIVKRDLSCSHTNTRETPPDLLYGGQALQVGAVLVLLQGRRLQHEVLLLGCVHLMQVLGRHALRSVDGVLDHLVEHTADTSATWMTNEFQSTICSTRPLVFWMVYFIFSSCTKLKHLKHLEHLVLKKWKYLMFWLDYS